MTHVLKKPAFRPLEIVRDLQVEYRPLTSLIPHRGSVRQYPDEQVEQIAQALNDFGWISPIVVCQDRVLIGHGRFLAAQRLGENCVSTISLDNLSDEQLRAYLVIDRMVSALAGWETDLFALEIPEQPDVEFVFEWCGIS